MGKGSYYDLGSLFLGSGAEPASGDDKSQNRLVPKPLVEEKKRIISNSVGAVSPGGGIAFASNQPRSRGVPGQLHDPKSFKDYMSKLQADVPSNAGSLRK